MIGFSKKNNIANLPIIGFSELKKRTRTVVIDDDPNSFPFELLEKEGYAIDHWDDIKELSKLEDGFYDIIFLDIQGIGHQYSEEEGLGILEHLKRKNPNQIIVAFSGHSFDLSKNKFWKLADDALCKPVQATKCKQIIDSLIKDKLTPSHYWVNAAQLLATKGYSQKDVEKLESKIYDAVERKDSPAIGKIINSCIKNAEVAAKVIDVALKIAALVP